MDAKVNEIEVVDDDNTAWPNLIGVFDRVFPMACIQARLGKTTRVTYNDQWFTVRTKQISSPIRREYFDLREWYFQGSTFQDTIVKDGIRQVAKDMHSAKRSDIEVADLEQLLLEDTVAFVNDLDARAIEAEIARWDAPMRARIKEYLA